MLKRLELKNQEEPLAVAVCLKIPHKATYTGKSAHPCLPWLGPNQAEGTSTPDHSSARQGRPFGASPCLPALAPTLEELESVPREAGYHGEEECQTEKLRRRQPDSHILTAASHLQQLNLEEETALTSDEVMNCHYYNTLGNFVTKIRLLLELEIPEDLLL